MSTPFLPDQVPSVPSLSERILETLSERIVTGALPPGSPLRQDHVASEFRTSHVPVREAFRTLEARGLLVSEPRRGVRVAPLSPEAVIEVTEMRAALEAVALRCSFARLTREDLAEARDALEEGETSSEVLVWEKANRRFHRAITGPCRMPRLLGTIEDLHQASARILFLAWTGLDWQPRSCREHREILSYLSAGQLDPAQAALEGHVLSAGRALARQLEERRST